MAAGPHVDKARVRERFVVVVDDDASIREICADALLRAGYRVNVFEDGTLALGALTGDVPDVLVVDWNMPGLDGVELARRARLLDPRLPVLMMTGNPPDAVPAAERVGIRYVLAKPFFVEDLLAAVAAALTAP